MGVLMARLSQFEMPWNHTPGHVPLAPSDPPNTICRALPKAGLGESTELCPRP